MRRNDIRTDISNIAFFGIMAGVVICLGLPSEPTPAPEPTPANERSLLVRPASASPEDQELAKNHNGFAPEWNHK